MRDKNREKQGKISYILTRETLGMTLMLFSVIVLIMLLTFDAVFAGIGSGICTFMYGTFGYGSILLTAVIAYLGEWLVFGKRIKISPKKTITICLTAFSLFLLFHAVTTRDYSTELSYGGYISDCYINASTGFSGYTFGGVVSALLVYPVTKLGGYVTAYVLFSVLVLLCGYLTFLAFRRGSGAIVGWKRKERVSNKTDKIIEETHIEREEPKTVVHAHLDMETDKPQVVKVRPVVEHSKEERYEKKNYGNKILFEKGEFAAESYRRNMIFNDNSYFNSPAVSSEEDYLSSFSIKKPVKAKSYTESYKEEIINQPAAQMPSSYVYGEKPVENLDVEPVKTEPDYSEVYHELVKEPEKEPARESIERPETVLRPEPAVSNPYKIEDNYKYADDAEETLHGFSNEPEESEPVREIITPSRERVRGFSEQAEEREEAFEKESSVVEETESETKDDIYSFLNNGSSFSDKRMSRAERSNSELFDDNDDDEDTDERIIARTEVPQPTVERIRDVSERREPLRPAPAPAPVPEVKEEKPKHIWKKYVRPSFDLLDDYPENANVNTGEIEDNKRIICETLNRFKIASEVANVTIGPAITRYDVVIKDKTLIKRAVGYRDAIAMELRKDNVNTYLNYSKGAMSVEVPNNRRTIVGLKNMLTSQKYINSKPTALAFALGKNVDGEVICPDITKMPHLLVAGTTGSGKSICLSALLVSLLYKYGPEELRLILVDPKQVEFISYDRLPHLMINEIISDCDKAIKALNWAIKEMERRYTLFREMTSAGKATKNLDEYNAHLAEGEEKVPKIVIVLDEFGDLMLQAKKDVESRIIKLVQKARACGIHLILATQRPSVDCITGLIKSNLPTRIGFKVNSFDDSRTIFDIGGAEKLLGKGDAYFRSAENPDLARIQCCFVDTHEVQKVTDFVKEHNEAYFDQDVSDFINTVEQEETVSTLSGGGDGDDGETKIDDTFIKALNYCVTSNQASVSMIQRRFPVGYIKACKIIDWMENMSYITPSEGSKPRKVLLSKDEFFNIYGDVDD
ncbi:MAG: DNA translocase FtsK [Clostridia bacterium]|nr:DNA translocase FtsK [Clostridia bacterium]